MCALFFTVCHSLSFPLPCGFPRHMCHWFSKPDIMDTQLPGAGPPGWGALHGTQTPHSSGMASTIALSLPFVSCHTTGVGLVSHYTMGVGPVWTMSLPLLPVSRWLFLYILSCVRSVLLVFRSFSEILVLHVVVDFGAQDLPSTLPS